MTETPGPSLPEEAADKVTQAFHRFLKIELAAGGLLLVSTIAALVCANSSMAEFYARFWDTSLSLTIGSVEFGRTLHHIINDGLMTLFFFVISLELKRELVLGELRNPRLAALPLAGALGGMIVPVAIYIAVMIGQPGLHGWGMVMATDTAFVIGCLAIFGRRIPVSLRLFLLSLAIFDDVGAILVVALGYGEAITWPALALAFAGLSVIAVISRIGVRNVSVYFGFGALVWLSFDLSGVHATLTGVILGMMTPARVWVTDLRLRSILANLLANPVGDNWSGDTAERQDLRSAGRAVNESLSPVERLELMLHPWVGFVIMPLFAFANAGVTLHAADFGQRVSIAIIAGLVLGKPIGVLALSWIAVRTGLASLAPGLSWGFITAGACLTGIGFTMSLFIAGLAFDTGALNAAKLGILSGSVISAVIGILLLAFLGKKPTVQID